MFGAIKVKALAEGVVPRAFCFIAMLDLNNPTPLMPEEPDCQAAPNKHNERQPKGEETQVPPNR